MTSWIESLITHLGYAGIALLMFIENVFPPIPSEIIMPLAGYTAGRGHLNIWLVIAAGTVGTFFGALLWYYVGRWLDEDRMRSWTRRHGRWLTMTVRDLNRVDRWFDRSGQWAVLIGRVIPTIRTLISVPAGIFRMPLHTFCLFTFFGSLAWNAALALIGRSLGQNYEAVDTYLGPVSMTVLAVILLYYLYRLVTFRPQD